MVARKIKGKWYLFSRTTGKRLGGPYSTIDEIRKRERQIQYFKHMRKPKK